MKRTRIYTYGGKPARRNLTVAELITLKGKTRLSQTCPGTQEEAAACEAAGVDVLSTASDRMRGWKPGGSRKTSGLRISRTDRRSPYRHA